MFLNKEKREQKQQLERRIGELKTHHEELKRHGQQRLEEMGQAIESYKQSVAEKWEYLQVSDKNVGIWGSLNNLGSMGWELVGVSNFTEKQTIGITVEGTIFTMYVFKRRVVDIPEEVLLNFSDIEGLDSELAQVSSEIKGLQRELSSL